MFLLLDIGATNLRMAISHSGLRLDRIVMAHTPSKYKEAIKVIKALAESLTQGDEPKLVCCGVPSPLDEKKQKLLDCLHPDWTGKNFAKDLEQTLKADIKLENDAALAALGEATYGAGKNYGIVAFLTISSGIGGARIVDNRIDESASGFEPKLQILSPATMENFEQLASGTYIEKKYGQKGESLKDPQAWNEIEKWIAIGINNAIAFWSPDILIIGGPVSQNKNISLKRVQDMIKKNLSHLNKFPKLAKAELGQQSGLYGALKLVKK